MSGDTDKLAQIEALVKRTGYTKPDDALALVEIAKAARAFGMGDSDWRRVEEALSALDGDTWSELDF